MSFCIVRLVDRYLTRLRIGGYEYFRLILSDLTRFHTVAQECRFGLRQGRDNSFSISHEVLSRIALSDSFASIGQQPGASASIGAPGSLL
jgi:hypothetical protein